MKISYRDMTALDIPVVASMERAIYPNDAWSSAQFKEELAGVPANRLYRVALDAEGTIVGYAGIFASDLGTDADIHTLTVSPGYRRKGLGRALLEEMIAWAKERQAPAVFLEVREGNNEAAPLYLSSGFTPISRRDDYYGTGVHAVVMKKNLS